MKVIRFHSSFRLQGDQPWIAKANEFFQIQEARALSNQSIRAYAFDLLTFFRWLEHNKVIWDQNFSQKHLQDWMMALVVTHQPRSTNRMLVCVRVFYRFCFDNDVPHAPGAIYPRGYYKHRREGRLGLFLGPRRHSINLRVQVPKTIATPLSPEEVDGFLDHIRRYRDLGIMLTMLFCGLRSQEVIGLRLEDVDFNQQQIKVRGKGRRERMVPMPTPLIKVFEKYLEMERPQNTSAAFFVVFQGKRAGCAMAYPGIWSLFRYRRMLTHIDRAKPHQFRHTFASDMARAGVPISSLQKLMGHAEMKTCEIYIHLNIDDVRSDYNKAIKRIEERYAAL